MKKILAAGLGTMIFTFWMLGASSASALSFYNYGEFNTAAGTPTPIDFEGNNSGDQFFGNNIVIGGTLSVNGVDDVTFNQTNGLQVYSSGFFSTNTSKYLMHNSMGSGAAGPVVIEFTSDVYYVGMDLAWLGFMSPGSGVLTISLADSFGIITESFSTSIAGPLSYSSTPMVFVGFGSNIAFSSITINDQYGISDGLMIDNFAHSHTAPPDPSVNNAVPEPSTMLLLGSGLLGLVGLNRRRKA